MTTFEQMQHVAEIECAAAKVSSLVKSFAETRASTTTIDHLGAATEAATHLYLLLYAHAMLFGRDGAPEPRGLLRGHSWLEGLDNA